MAVVKSRDMHWALLAQKDHKDVNLSSLRLLLVADGANPCEYTVYIFLLLSVNKMNATHIWTMCFLLAYVESALIE